MKSAVKVSMVTFFALALLAGQLIAAETKFKKGPNYNNMNTQQLQNGLDVTIYKLISNGFPSGPHYNLNIIGKKDLFTCPPQELDTNGAPIYGNVIFVPEMTNGNPAVQDPTQIVFESGLKGPRAPLDH